MLTTERAVLIRYRRDGRSRRGSGLRIGGRLVLTAAHCANGSDHKIWVGGAAYPAGVVVSGASPGADLAVLQVDGLPEVDVLSCARVDRERAAEVTGCQALGFPTWNDGAEGPRLAQVKGFLPTAEGIVPQAVGETPALTLRITDQQIREPVSAGDLDQPGSPWAGMSGAVVVTESDQIVGVVRSHSLAAGVGALTLTPLDGIDRLPQEAAERFWDALHVVDPSTLPILPLLAAGLRRAAAVARSYAPAKLLHRDDWLAELTGFAAGPLRCRWVCGDPWSGKTALLAWFVMNPPPASVLVSHFVPAADPQRSTSDAFLKAMVDQLAAVAGTGCDREADQVAEFSRLLGAAAESCARAKKALVLVVDGLDQDRSRDQHLPSIGALLLRKPPESVHVLIASRKGYSIPDDVDAASLLRNCRKLELPQTPYVRELRERAESELQDQAEDKTGRELLRYLTAAGAALDESDLAELTGIDRLDIREHISGHLGRSLRHVTPSSDSYVFAHEELSKAASNQLFRQDLPIYRTKIRDWADRRCNELAGRRWPVDSTPVFLLEGYRYFLRDCADGVDALATLLEDHNYQEAMRDHYGWLDEYVRDIEWVADKDPSRAASLCLTSLKGMFPNSLLRQHLLDLLIQTSPKIDRRQARGALDRDIDRIVEMLRKPQIDRDDEDWLIDHYEQAKEQRSVRPALLVLAMGRTCRPRLRAKLLQIFQSSIRGVNWAAADALLTYSKACSDRALADDVIRSYKETSNWAKRERALYVLAGMRVPQAKEIASEALNSRHWRVVGEALRVLKSIPHLTSDDLDRLLRLLQEQVSEAGPQGPWRDDWVRKRLIRAIHEHYGDLNTIQKKQAVDLIAQLTAAVTDQPMGDATKRRRLLQAIDNASHDIGS